MDKDRDLEYIHERKSICTQEKRQRDGSGVLISFLHLIYCSIRHLIWIILLSVEDSHMHWTDFVALFLIILCYNRITPLLVLLANYKLTNESKHFSQKVQDNLNVVQTIKQ